MCTAAGGSESELYRTSVESPVRAEKILAGWLMMVDSTSPGDGGLLKKAT